MDNKKGSQFREPFLFNNNLIISILITPKDL